MITKKQAFLIVPLVISTLIIIVGLIGYFIGAVFGLPTRLGLPQPVRVLGVIVLLAGFSLLGWVFSYRKPVDVFVSTFLTMQKVVTGTLTKDKSARAEPLVIEGPQRYVRHPMYFAVVVMVLGWWLVLDYTFILLMVGLFILWFNLVVIRFEEQELRAIFGEQYESYSKSVPRFIPSFRPRREK
jgi:protein-S-isoprenylcysteine O-methyltransferase Ste14